MKRFIAAILSAAFVCMTLPLSVGAVSAGYSDISVYSFEDGKVPGKLSTANDKAEIVSDGLLGGKYALKVTNSRDSAAGWKLPVSFQKGITYNVSFYFKPVNSADVSFRPLLYGADKQQYAFTEISSSPVTIEKMTSVGDGWYFYSKKYYNTKLSGTGSFELRWTKANGASYLLDDVKVVPEKLTDNSIFSEDFEGVSVSSQPENTTKFYGAVKNYTGYATAAVLNDAGNSDINNYIQIEGTLDKTAENAGIATDAVIDISPGKSYKLSFDAKAVNDTAVGARVMWFAGNTKVVDTNYIPALTLTKKWQHFEAPFDTSKVTDVMPNQVLKTKLTGSKGKGGTFAFDNIKLVETDKDYSVSIPEKLFAGGEAVFKISGAGSNYFYTITAMNDEKYGVIVSSGTTEKAVVKYTPSADVAGKTLKISVTAYDNSCIYNTAEAVTSAVAGVNEIKFTSQLSKTVTGKAVQYDFDNAVAFLALFDENDRLIGVDAEFLPKARTAALSTTSETDPAYAKLIMIESILSMKPILAAVTLETERDNHD
ncbi:MAG: carbohydrate binding domain-containing protein [Clostridia bacterium]|nr:carbohydrate binding domain-containing protein [Clostridia bacterium]